MCDYYVIENFAVHLLGKQSALYDTKAKGYTQNIERAIYSASPVKIFLNSVVGYW